MPPAAQSIRVLCLSPQVRTAISPRPALHSPGSTRQNSHPLLQAGGSLNNHLRHAGATFLALFLLTLPPVSAPQQNAPQTTPAPPQSPQDWPRYGGPAQVNHFTPLPQINHSKANQIQLAPTSNTGAEGD